MKSSLHTLQVLAKIGKILSKIVEILCIIGAVFCLAGSVALVTGVATMDLFTDYGISFFTKGAAGQTVSNAYAAMVCGFISCTGQAVLAGFAAKYFRHELDAGTPFTFMGAKEMKALGIITIVIPIAVSILSSVICGMLTMIMGDFGKLNITGEVSIGLGVMFLVLSAVFRYGAEIAQAHDHFDL